MVTATAETRTVSERALRDFWHPVAWSEGVGAEPVQVELLDERVVLYRLTTGSIAALRDLCLHRGTPLSRGRIDLDRIVCPYDGWTYAADGRLVDVPLADPERGIPAGAAVTAYGATERHGLVWVCLGEPKAPIAEFPEWGDPRFRIYYRSTDDWAASGPRLVENFVDTAHFAWVHPGILGDRSRPLVPDIIVRRHGWTIEVELEMASAGGLQTGMGSTRIWDEVTLPMTVRQVRTDAAGQRNVIFLAICPLSSRRLRRFTRSMRDFDLDEDDAPYREQSALVQNQDRAIVEEQRPEELPVDLAEEMHIRGPDDPAVVYRRALAALGIDG